MKDYRYRLPSKFDFGKANVRSEHRKTVSVLNVRADLRSAATNKSPVKIELRQKSYLVIRLFTVVFLLTTLNGCSYISSAGSFAYDVIMWPPRKVWQYTGSKIFDVKNEQQTEMGPRRKPAGNPTGGSSRGAMPDYQMPPMGQNNAAPAYPPMPQVSGYSGQQGGFNQMPPMPAMNQGGGAGYPGAQGSGNMNMPVPQGMPDMQQMGQIPGASGADMGMGGAQPPYPTPSQPSYPSVNPYGSANSGAGGANGMPPMPPMPQMGKNPQSPYGMPPVGPMGGGMGGSDQDSMEADAAFAGGGRAGKEKHWWSWIPFTPNNYKMEKTYEPLAAEFTLKAKDLDDNSIRVEPLELPHHRVQNAQASKQETKAARTASMFPLEQYAPKPMVISQNTTEKDGTYPKLGEIPANTKSTVDTDQAAAQLEKIMKESEAAQAKQSAIHNTDQNAPQEISPEAMPQNQGGSKYKLSNQNDLATKAPSSRYGTLGSEKLKNDAEVIKSVPKDTRPATESPQKKETKPGFFSKLFHRTSDTNSPKIIRRKSQPPTPEELASKAQRPLPQAELTASDDIDAMKNFQPSSGSLLPKARYTDRRKVPQTEE